MAESVCLPNVDETGTLDDVNWLLSAHYIHDLQEIKVRHEKTFHLRQSLIKTGNSSEIPIKYPRFFDVDVLVSC